MYNGSSSTVSNNNKNSTSNSRKMDSPELRPLPPLNAQQSFRRSNRSNADVASSKDDEDEEFYSPRGSLNGRESSIATGSASRRAFASIEVERFKGSTSNSSSTCTSSASGSRSGSPARSISLSLSPANSLSPIHSIPKSPDLIEIQAFAQPLRRQPPSSPPPRDSMVKESASPSPPSSSSPDRYSRRSEESSPRFSNVSDQKMESPERISSSVQFPPPPPPPPPAIAVPAPPPPPLAASKLWESPRTPKPPNRKPISHPPTLITPLRPIAVESPTLISPFQLPTHGAEIVGKNGDKASPSGENVQQNEETTPKPKLKPLHWDKVRASSDREMVWDQLKCSSFKYDHYFL